jgi:hypothetical protein|tara:strand:+ start:1657 stop:1932 length:276 start_codon:yes stop_codon:yes gene_type:complete
MVKIHSAYETYIRSLHATEKGALLEFCSHVADQLLQYEFEKEEVALLNEIMEYTKQDKTATDTLKSYKNVMEEFGERVEMWPEIMVGTLLP